MVSRADGLSGGDGEAGKMAVARGDAVSVVDHDGASVAALKVGEGHDAVGGQSPASPRSRKYRRQSGTRLLR